MLHAGVHKFSKYVEAISKF